MIELGVNQYLKTGGAGSQADPFTIAVEPVVAAAPATGSIALGVIANGNLIDISDGTNPATTFEFDTGAAATGGLTITAARPSAGNTIRFHFTAPAPAEPDYTFEFIEGNGAVTHPDHIAVIIGTNVTEDGEALLAAIKSTIANLNNASTTGAFNVAYGITLTWGQVGEAGNCTFAVTGESLFYSDMTGGLDPGDAVDAGHVGVAIGATSIITAANLLAAINATVTLEVTASPTEPASNTIDLENNHTGTAGNVAITKTGNGITVTGMVGGGAAITMHTLQNAITAQTDAINALIAALTP